MELERHIGPVLMVGFRGLSVDEDNSIMRDIAECGMCTVVLFDVEVSLWQEPRNIASLQQVEPLDAGLGKCA